MLILAIGTFTLKHIQSKTSDSRSFNQKKLSSTFEARQDEQLFNKKTPQIINSLRNSEIQEELKNMSMQFIAAEYEGDREKLLEITRKDAKKAVENGELDIFKSHKLDGIVYFNFVERENPDEYLVIVAVAPINETIYYEHLIFNRFDGDWLITQIERDV